MKKLFIAGLIYIIATTSVHVQAMEQSLEKLNLSLIPAKHADEQQGVIESREQLINLMQISKTTRNMAYDIIPHQIAPEIAEDPDQLVHFMRCDTQLCNKIFSMVQKKEEEKEEKEGLFPNIDQQTLDHVLDLSTQQFEQFATLMGYSDDKLINIIKAANYLDAEGLLNRATSEFAINRALSNAHLDQLLTSKGFDQYYEQLGLPAEMDNAIVKYLLKNHPSFRADLVKSRFWPKDWDVESIITSSDGDYLISRPDDRTWRFFDSKFNSAVRNLALKDAQVIKALMTGKITLETMPQHLREIYDGMPDVLKSLFTQ